MTFIVRRLLERQLWQKFQQHQRDASVLRLWVAYSLTSSSIMCPFGFQGPADMSQGLSFRPDAVSSSRFGLSVSPTSGGASALSGLVSVSRGPLRSTALLLWNIVSCTSGFRCTIGF